MKIVLILPRVGLYRYRTGAFAKYLRYAPLTLTTLAALVPPELDAEIEIFDEGVQVVPKERIDADIVGITAITGASQRAYAFADYFRAKRMTVVMGGVHATLMPEEAKQHADAVVIGPGYETWPKVLTDFSARSLQPFYHAPEKIDFNRIPKMPARDKLRERGYFTVDSIQAVFGCPNSCEFCVTPYSCKGYQHRPIGDVIAELKTLKGRLVTFVDPSPIEDAAYAVELCRAMIPLKKRWTSLATTRLLHNPELMDAMAESGCGGLLIGFESLSQRTNNRIAKGFNHVNEYYELIRQLHARGIAIMGCFVHGLDDDGPDCFEQTLDFVYSANVDLPRFTICTPFPGTRFFSRLKQEGRIFTEDWSLYDGQHAVFQPKGMTVEELETGHKLVWRKSYTLRSMAKRLACSRSFLSVSFLTNFAYRRYAACLPNYHRERMMDEVNI